MVCLPLSSHWASLGSNNLMAFFGIEGPDSGASCQVIHQPLPKFHLNVACNTSQTNSLLLELEVKALGTQLTSVRIYVCIGLSLITFCYICIKEKGK